MLNNKQKIIITGHAGFVGFHMVNALLEQGWVVIGIDNMNAYYDVELKQDRLNALPKTDQFTSIIGEIADPQLWQKLLEEHGDATHVLHLAAQAGVRYSLKAPQTYIDSNLQGFFQVMEFVKRLKNCQNFVFASSSSVYGDSTKFPLSTNDRTDEPISLYAATKKANEVMAHSYSHLFGIPTTGLRFFTVYGPWGRPDMSPYIFTDHVANGKAIPLYGDGSAVRSFTYIDDIVAGIMQVLNTSSDEKKSPYRLFNLGNDQTDVLKDMIGYIEAALGKKAEIDYQPSQQGDVKKTAADIAIERETFGLNPQTSLRDGIEKFVAWYVDYHKIDVK